MSHEKNVGQIHHEKKKKKILWEWSTVQIIGNANNKSELHALRG